MIRGRGDPGSHAVPGFPAHSDRSLEAFDARQRWMPDTRRQMGFVRRDCDSFRRTPDILAGAVNQGPFGALQSCSRAS